MAPEKIASIAAGPALKVLVFTGTPRCLAYRSFSTPTRAVAWVMLGKKPSLTSLAAPVAPLPPVAAVSPPQAAASVVSPSTASVASTLRVFMAYP